MGVEAGGEHLGRIARQGGHLVTRIADPAGLDEVFVQVIDELAHAVLQGGADAGIVDHRDVLDEFAEPDTPRMRTDRHTELRREQQHGEVLVYAAETAGINLAEGDRACLQQLLEEDSVHPVFSGRHADPERLHRAGNGGMPQDVVGGGGFLNPPRFERRAPSST